MEDRSWKMGKRNRRPEFGDRSSQGTYRGHFCPQALRSIRSNVNLVIPNPRYLELDLLTLLSNNTQYVE